MELFRFLMKISKRTTVLAGVICLVSGGLNGLLMAVIHRALTYGEAHLPLSLAAAFVAAGAGKLITVFASDVLLTRRAQQATLALSLDLIRKLQRVPLRSFERLGQSRINAAFTDDIHNLSEAFYELPIFAINSAIVLGGAAYLVYLSIYTLLTLGVFTLIGALVYRGVIGRAHRYFHRSMREKDRLQNHFLSLWHGMKVLKLHRPRRRVYTDVEVTKTAETYIDLDVSAHVRYLLSYITATLFLLVIIGMTIFVIPTAIPISRDAVSGYVITALYLMGPMGGVAAAFPLFGRARVSLKRLQALGVTATQRATETSDEGDELRDFDCIELKEAVFSFHDTGDLNQFVLGPINLSIRPKEIVFITGGNGSGKSTLAKMLTGLYEPDEGALILDGAPVTDDNRDTYRQLFTAIFSDAFLFETLMGLESPMLDDRAARYLKLLAIDHKVRIEDGKLSTTALSRGQRKRLALLTAYLEDRPVYLFDEWAADQDPTFKEVFYSRLIRELKSKGKTVIVITHDDRYFNVADRRYEMRDGRLRSVG